MVKRSPRSIILEIRSRYSDNLIINKISNLTSIIRKARNALSNYLAYDISLIFVGIITGILFTAPISGVLVNAPGSNLYAEGPQLETNVEKIDVNHNNGEKLRGYRGLEWQYGYQIYHISIRNVGPSTAIDLETVIDFPGCIISYRKQRGKERISVDPLVDSYIVKGNASSRVAECEQEIGVDKLPPDNTVSMSVVVAQWGTGFPSEAADVMTYDEVISRNYTVEYDWMFHGHREPENVTATVENAEEAYVDAYLAIGKGALKNNKTSKALYFHRKAYEVSPNDSTVLRKYGFALSQYGHDQGKEEHVRRGLKRIKEAISRNTTDHFAWYYRATAHVNLALMANSSRFTKIHYCLAIGSLKQAKKNGTVIPRAISLQKRLDQHRPNVKCTVNNS